ncbi:hypothetical protein ACHQM5_001273 [Ranunculus cassubicifolius]
MASNTLSLVLVFCIYTIIACTAYPSSNPSAFIKSSCSVTLYPSLCIQSLSSYADTIQENPKQMAQAALTVSLSVAKSVKVFVTKMSKSKGLKRIEYKVLKDCVDNVGDSVDRLSMSIQELGHMGHGEENFIWHMSNAQTWVSAALTEENTCLDGFAGRGGMDGRLKTVIRSKITSVARVTSNALALVNRFAERH